MPRKRFTAPLDFVGAAMLALAASVATAQGPGGPPGGGPGGPGGFGPGTFLAPQVLKFADSDKDGKLSPDEASKAAAEFIRSSDPKKSGSIDSDALRKAINTTFPPPNFVGGDDGPPPGEVGPGNFIAPLILQGADSNKDGKLSPDEAARAAEAFIKAADTGKTGSIDVKALGDAMNRQIGPPGMGGPGGPMGQERKLLKEFDKDGNGHLDTAERKAARDSIKAAPGGGRRFGPPGGMFGGGDEKGKPGPKVAKADAPSFAGKPLYEPTVLRTLFLDFEGDGWEPEMAAFYNSDVEVPATLTADGRTYKDVGVHFRGASSFFAVAEGSKRSLNVSLDDVHSGQTLEGYKTLNLLNSHEDSTALHTVLYFHIARSYLPAPKANFVKVVINGESWGVYVNAQQFDKTFVKEWFGDTKGARWKVKGNPGARGGLEYLGEDAAPYKQKYQIKTGDNPADWKRFIELCRILNQTPPEKLEEALKPILDIEGVLWFLALDNALINNDGYWVRSSDYSIALDASNKFHIIPHDANETFGAAMMMGFPGGFGRPGGAPGGPPGGAPGGPGGGQGRPGGPGGPGRGPGGMGVELDPLIGLDDAAKPLRSKLLAVPALRAKYLEHVRTIATDWLDWDKLGPVVAQYRAVIDKEVEADTRKLMSHPAYLRAVGEEVKGEAPRGRPEISLKDFAAKRRKYLLEYAEIKKLDAEKR
jgi:CotH kinase protein/EF hand